MIMHPFEIEQALKTFTILIDTREQPTERLKERVKVMGVPTRREKLNFGDYSAEVTYEDETISLKEKVCVERKMDIDELCSCYCQERARYTREFERAKEAGARIYMLIENASWEKMYSGNYRSLMNPNSLTASVIAWLARYECIPIFCKSRTTGWLIKDILYREMKERLEKL